MINNVTLQGNITRDLELRPAGNTTVLNFSVASTRNTVDKATGERKSDFINCVAFSKTAELIAKHFEKGSEILILGRIQTGSYTNKEGNKVYTTDVIVDQFSFTRGSNNNRHQQNQENDTRTLDKNEQAALFDSMRPPFEEGKTIDIDNDSLPF